MSEKVCRYCKDEFCVNAECPMRADYCPVPDMPGVCRYEERIEVKPEKQKRLSPYECLIEAIRYNGPTMSDVEIKDIYEAFRATLAEHDWEIVEYHEDEVSANDQVEPPKKYCVGQELSVDEVADSDYWKLKSFNSNPFNTTCTYINHDHTMIIVFEHGKDRGTVEACKE